MQLKTGPNDNNRRIDRILRKALPDYPLSLIHRLLRQGKIRVNGKRAAPEHRIPSGALITVPGALAHAPGSLLLTANDSPLTTRRTLPPLLWQNSDLLILNKPTGIAVHGSNSLDTQVQSYLAGHQTQPEYASISFKPGPLHRLDKPSSGIIVFSKSLDGARNFSLLMRERKIQKQYLAIMEGCIKKTEIWDNLLIRDRAQKKTTVLKNTENKSALPASTTVSPLAASINPYKNKYTLVLARIHTGRTHQIRAQAAAHGHPLMGDQKYGGNKTPPPITPGFFLHAWKIKIDDRIEVSADLPDTFQNAIKTIFGINGNIN